MAQQAKSPITEEKRSQKASQQALTPQKILNKKVESMAPRINKALPKDMTPERFMSVVQTAISENPELADCTLESFFGAMMSAAQLGLEINSDLQHAYIIPYWNSKKGVREAQFQLGYQGLLALAYRSGKIISVDAHEVCDGDEFTLRYGLDSTLEHAPVTRGRRGEPYGYYAVWKGENGAHGFFYMTKEEIVDFKNQHAKSDNVWEKNFDAMAKKTVIKQLLKYAPISSETQLGVASDMTVRNIPESAVGEVNPLRVPNTLEVEYEVEQASEKN